MQSVMQSDTVGNIAVDQREDDRDSLFGSPPSSPIKGRSPSPALALPSASNSTQNVGTIALPGSHHYSELPVTPLALPLSNALNELPLRPPAPSTTARHPSVPTSTSTSPSWSRASSIGPTSKPKRKTSKKAKSKESTPRPSPEIPLPDPSGPVPQNFLRNQSALLGTAGLVGGVNPAHLSTHRHTRGTNPSNPIVVEDDEGPPVLGRFRQPCVKPVDPSLLPTPSTQNVVAMLIGQKDIFPVLESLLRLIASGSASQAPPPQSSFRRPPHPFQTPSSAGPPPKKRKLNRVPAGAADWDVPYPFPPGQGPVSYRTNWERERGKQLISQLVNLIKSAARKAATRLYYQNEQAKKQMIGLQRAEHAQTQEPTGGSGQSNIAEPKVHGRYGPSTATYGSEGEAATAAAKAQAQEVLTDASNVNTKSAMAQAPSPYQLVQTSNFPALQPQPTTPFDQLDQLISSLLAATPDQNFAPDSSSATASPIASNPVANVMGAGSNNISMQPDANTGANTLDQGLFDNWMNVLQTFPMPSEGFSQPQNQWGLPVQPSTSTSTSTHSDFNFFDSEQTYTDTNYTGATSFDVGKLFDTTDTMTMTASPPTAGSACPQPQPQLDPSPSHDDAGTMFPQSQPDFAIDPSLLAISIPQPSQPSQPSVTSTSNGDVPPSLTASPIPSQSSFGEAEPTTPKSATWDLSMPEILNGSSDASSGDKSLVTGQGYHSTGLAGQGGADEYINALFGHQAQGQGKDGDMSKVDKGKGRDMGDSVPEPHPLLPAASQIEGVNAPVTSPSPAPSHSAAASKASDNPPNKLDVMRRAVTRRKQLMDEISNVRTQLWETTIEQGVLSHMSKLCNHTT